MASPPQDCSTSVFGISDEPGSAPHIRVVTLVPVDEALPTGNARYRGPTAAEADIVLAVEKVSGVARIEVHGLETRVWSQI